ncbi:MAG: hypothetical protein EPN21_13385 [Methylococcaceae bacterium]|nr:MAG: hypothetical protein EPN21_13385 [Methylococcaceae bacterium]
MNTSYYLSLGLFLTCRRALRGLIRAALRRKPQTAAGWQGYSEILRRQPLFFHYLMFQAPRWNCHALIGVLPTFKVERHIRVDLAAAGRAAPAWTLVLYAGSDDTRTVAALGPDREADADGFYRLDLEPGEYRLGARYYQARPEAVWPEIRIDERTIIPARPVGQEAQTYQNYLAGLRGRDSWFYRIAHHHLFAALAATDPPTPELDRLILPVGNPDTRFHYGLLPEGSALRLNLEPEWQQNALAYLTVLNRASLPLYWCRVADNGYLSPRFAEPALYLIRLQALAGSQLPPKPLQLELNR